MDVVSDGSISMDRVTYLVLDEGDRMLDEGFEDQMRSIASRIREDRHMLFFSATWPKKVQDLAKNLCQSGQRPMRIRVGQSNESGATSREDIVQEVVVFDDGDWGERDVKKQKFLAAHLREALEQEGTKVLVFVSTKDLAEKMSWQFHKEGFPASALHGGRSQDQRMKELEKFKNSEVRLLVTTDVMGRGLDIPSISHVVVYDMGDIDDYVHRIGRTARGPYGKGHALTLFEYNPKWPHIAEGLVLCLEAAGQHVPPELRQVAQEVERGEREVKAMKAGSKWGALSGWQGSAKDVARSKLGYDDKDWGKDWGSW
jgi:ATP-dependent RNA helicase DDX5/DBP2